MTFFLVLALFFATPDPAQTCATDIAQARKDKSLLKDASPAVYLEEWAREHHDEHALAVALTALGWTEETAHHWNAAGALYEEAAAHARNCGDDATLADAAFGLSFVHRGLGNNDAVFTSLEEARAAAKRGDRRDLYPLIVNATAVWKRVYGDLNESIALFREVLAYSEASGNQLGIAGATNNLAHALQDYGDEAEAIRDYERALAIAEKSHNDRIAAYALNNLGAIYADSRDFDRAQSLIERSLELKAKVHDPTRASNEVNLGELARRRHQSLAAFHWYQRALGDASEWETQADALCDLAQLALDDHRPHAARDFATRAATLASAHDVAGAYTAAMTVRGHALRELGRRAEARTAYDDAIRAIEQERAKAGGGETQRTLFLERRLDPYFGAVSLLRATKPREALAYAEKTKARVLLDLRGGGAIDTSAPVRTAKGETAIEFVTTDDETIVFVINGSQVHARRISLAGAALAHEVETLREQIASRDLRSDATSARLFHRLLGDVWPLVGESKRLVIVPDGALWELPFAALVAADGRYLIEHVSIVYAPSLAARAAMKGRRATASHAVLAFGSGLPEAEEQAREISGLYGGRAIVAGEATESRFKSDAPDARIIHIATHGILNDVNPMYSHLVLNADAHNDGLLTAREIVRMPLHCELAVLSACETARGRTHQGEGVVGLAWSFFLAGCPSTVVSQWSIDAASTNALMLAFHRELRGGATRSDALRDAALTMLRDPKSRHPFYWGAFVLIGDDSPI